MVTLRHPRWPDITQDVDPESVADWVASGWLDERECCGGSCEGCPTAKPEVKILPAPKPGPKRRTKTPSIGDD